MRLGQCPSIWSFFFFEGIPKIGLIKILYFLIALNVASWCFIVPHSLDPKGPTIVCSDCLDTISYRPIEAGEKMSIYFKQAYFGVIFMLWFFSNWWKKVTTFSHL